MTCTVSFRPKIEDGTIFKILLVLQWFYKAKSPLFRPRTNPACHQKLNSYREIVPLNNNAALTSIETLAASRHYSDLLCSAAGCCHKSHLPHNICKQKKRKFRRNYFKFCIAVCVIDKKFICLVDSVVDPKLYNQDPDPTFQVAPDPGPDPDHNLITRPTK